METWFWLNTLLQPLRSTGRQFDWVSNDPARLAFIPVVHAGYRSAAFIDGHS
jgi:hypothetical protein